VIEAPSVHPSKSSSDRTLRIEQTNWMENRDRSSEKRPIPKRGRLLVSKAATTAASRDGSTSQEARATDIWVKCPGCKEIAFRKEVERNLNVCLKCGYQLRLTVEQRLAITVDRGSWRELFADLEIGDPLEFVDSRPYRQRLEAARRSSGRNDAVVTGIGKIEGRAAAIAVMDFNFMGGSMGVVVGEKLARLIGHGLKWRLPVIAFSSSGGARMQEGTLSLMQMAKVAAALSRLHDARIPYISVLCDPTTGGVAASFASLGDLNIAEPGAVIGFAGRRVIEQTTNQQLPDGFQTAEFLLRHGMLDAIVPRHRMRAALAQLLAMLAPRRSHRRLRS
jgi:acetyl-CoA carboxylase carboxyl transferase subunit beta